MDEDGDKYEIIGEGDGENEDDSVQGSTPD